MVGVMMKREGSANAVDDGMMAEGDAATFCNEKWVMGLNPP